MFDHHDSVIGLLPGEGTEVETSLQAEDDLAYRVACLVMADGWSEDDQHFLPSNLEEI